MEDEAAISDGPHIIRRRAPDAMERRGRGRVGYQRPRASVIVDDGARVPDGPELARPVAPHCRSAVLRIEMVPAGAVVMPQISNTAVRGPDIVGGVPPNCPSAAVVVEASGCPRRARPMVRIRLRGAEPHVARSVHPEFGRAGPRRPRGVRKGIPLLPVPTQDGRVACEPNAGQAAPPANRKPPRLGNETDTP